MIVEDMPEGRQVSDIGGRLRRIDGGKRTIVEKS
jgi:hypothetical protein